MVKLAGYFTGVGPLTKNTTFGGMYFVMFKVRFAT